MLVSKITKDIGQSKCHKIPFFPSPPPENLARNKLFTITSKKTESVKPQALLK